MQGRVKLPCVRYMLLLVPRSIMGPLCEGLPAVAVSGCLFHGVQGFCVSVRVPLQLFLSRHLQSGICQSSLMGVLLLIGCQDQCSCGFIWVFLYCLRIYSLHHVYVWRMMYALCWDRLLVFLVFLYVARKKRFVIFILSQHPVPATPPTLTPSKPASTCSTLRCPSLLVDEWNDRNNSTYNQILLCISPELQTTINNTD